MTSDTELRKVLRMLGRAVYSWGVHSLDDDATDEREVLDNLSLHQENSIVKSR